MRFTAEISQTTIGVWLGVATAALVAIGTLGGLAIKIGLAWAKQLKDGMAELKTDQSQLKQDHAVNAANIQSNNDSVNRLASGLHTVQSDVIKVAAQMPSPNQAVRVDPNALAAAMHAAWRQSPPPLDPPTASNPVPINPVPHAGGGAAAVTTWNPAVTTTTAFGKKP